MPSGIFGSLDFRQIHPKTSIIMTFLDLIFAIVFMAIAVIALAVIRKNRVLTRQLDSRSRMMRDAFSENTRLKSSYGLLMRSVLQSLTNGKSLTRGSLSLSAKERRHPTKSRLSPELTNTIRKILMTAITREYAPRNFSTSSPKVYEQKHSRKS